MSIIKKPLITEKFSKLADKENKYGFIVTKKSTKDEIRKEVEKIFDVKVTSINTMVYLGKAKTRHTKRNIITGRRSSFKKAVVTLKKGDQIDFYSNI